MLKEDFEFFTDEQYLEEAPEHSLPNSVAIINTRYDVIFTHDWPFSDGYNDSVRNRQQIDSMKEKYSKRINRFRQLYGKRPQTLKTRKIENSKLAA